MITLESIPTAEEWLAYLDPVRKAWIEEAAHSERLLWALINALVEKLDANAPVVEQKPADAPTKENIEDVIYIASGWRGDTPALVADAILAAFGPRLRRQLSREEWQQWFSTQFQGWSAVESHSSVLAKRLVAKLADLEQPTPVPCVVTDSPDAGQGVGETECGPECPGAPCNKPDPIEERAVRLRNIGEQTIGNEPAKLRQFTVNEKPYWFAVARECEREVRAAKREALLNLKTIYYSGTDKLVSEVINEQLAALDEETPQ